jgi:calcium/calmodulin-dependent protein kinase (CaM kinase) II
MSVESELLDLSRRLLASIDAGEWKTYESLCCPSITCIEPEALGHLAEGLPCHKFYIDLPAGPSQTPAKQSSIASPHVRVLGDAAVVSYIRLVQKLDASGAPVSTAAMETRVWQKSPSGWKHVHFHRTPC